MNTLNQKQMQFVKTAMSGINCFLTGGGGVGKTFTINTLISMLPWKKIVCTASTGIASTHQINGQTIHSWSGIGTFSSTHDLTQVLFLHKFKERIPQIQECDILIIDEVSMMRGDQLDLLDNVLRNARRCKKPFGGIQVILVGDFLQLPPVVKKEEMKNIENYWAFNAKIWKEAQIETFVLTQIMRQSDEEFINALNDIRFGEFTDRVKNLVSKTSSTIFPSSIQPLKLMAVNKAVDEWNSKIINSIKKEPFVSSAIIHSKNAKFYHDICSAVLAPKNLTLKKGCQVMILKNDPEGRYVNGSMGTFVDHGVDFAPFKGIPDSSSKQEVIFVEINGQVISIPKHTFTIGDKYTVEVWDDGAGKYKKVTRHEGEFTQFPVRLGYAITVHKSQGMTLPFMEVNCQRMFAEGQFYVALSRSKDIKGLRVLNFKPYHLKANKEAVKFYRENMQ